MNKPTKVIYHCAATPDSVESKFDAKDIDGWHRKRGWRGIGYHYYIKRDGEVEEGRDEKEVGAHTKGQNKKSIGICYEGTHFPTVPQMLSTIELYQRLYLDYGIDSTEWYGHREFAPKGCPGFDPHYLRKILGEVKTHGRKTY